MPEGPEVRIQVEKTDKLVRNKNLLSIEILAGRYLKHGPPKDFDKITSNLPMKITSMNCKGKFIWFSFDKTDNVIANTLGMSGYWTKVKKKHDNVAFNFENFVLYFNDLRNFGTFKIMSQSELDKKLKTLGPDVLEEYNFEEFYKRLLRKRSDVFIGTALLDQKVISGVGNYLRSDILWYSKISPFSEVKNLSEKQLELIYRNCVLLTRRAYYLEKKIPVTQKEFGDLSKISRFFLVYSKSKDIYGNEIVRDKMGDRTIHWCPNIQK